MRRCCVCRSEIALDAWHFTGMVDLGRGPMFRDVCSECNAARPANVKVWKVKPLKKRRDADL